MNAVLVPKVSPGLTRRAPGPVSELHVGRGVLSPGAVMLTMCGHDGTVGVAPLSPAEARKLASMLRECAKPRCVDCGETERSRFYPRVNSRSGAQSRCKRCDNADRAKRQRTSASRRNACRSCGGRGHNARTCTAPVRGTEQER